MINKEEEEEVEQLITALANGNKKDVAYLMGRKLFFSKDPVERAEAKIDLDEQIKWYEDPNL